MISSVAQNSQTYSILANSRKKDGVDNVDNSFNELIPAVETENERLMKNAPDKWVTAPCLSFDAIDLALDYREKELGIPLDAEPTHELTPEQREWLYSRHDFSTMQVYVRYSYDYGGTTQYCTKATAEYSNFLADLAYLGIYSADEFIHTSPLDTRPGANSVLSGDVFNSLNSDNSLMGTARAFVSHLEKMWSFYDERSKSAFAVEGDAEFAELIKEQYLPINQQFFEFIDKLIRNDDEQPPQNSVAPNIEDASEKLKEDFGKLAQN